MKTIDVVCGFIKHNGKILITQRSDKKNYGKWEFPGGKVKVGEDIFSSIKRELIEELDLSVNPVKEINNYIFKSFNLIFIECTCSYTNTIKLKEHIDYLWIEIGELENFDFLEGDKRFILELQNNNI